MQGRPWPTWVVVGLVGLDAGYMVFDGLRALLVGDYLTPSSGPYAGQLGPWAGLAEAVGVPPRSTFMKVFFVVYGVAWFGALAVFLRGTRWGWRALVAFAAGSLWYLVIGTLSSVLQLVLLMLPSLRRGNTDK